MRPQQVVFLIAVVAILLPAPGFPAPVGSSAYSVLVSVADQRTYVYERGRLLRAMVCSTGIPDTDDATPLGDFSLNESGQKRGEWFYSESYGQGAKYWVGFIGGTYLIHSVPMDKHQRVIQAEASKLGKPASHGCIRLGLDDAYWFYTTVPDGTALRIIAGPHGSRPRAEPNPP